MESKHYKNVRQNKNDAALVRVKDVVEDFTIDDKNAIHKARSRFFWYKTYLDQFKENQTILTKQKTSTVKKTKQHQKCHFQKTVSTCEQKPTSFGKELTSKP